MVEILFKEIENLKKILEPGFVDSQRQSLVLIAGAIASQALKAYNTVNQMPNLTRNPGEREIDGYWEVFIDYMYKLSNLCAEVHRTLNNYSIVPNKAKDSCMKYINDLEKLIKYIKKHVIYDTYESIKKIPFDQEKSELIQNRIALLNKTGHFLT